MFELWSFRKPKPPSEPEQLTIGSLTFPLLFVRNPKAKRYLLRLTGDLKARVTVPRRGSMAEAKKFVERHSDWLANQIQKRQLADSTNLSWRIGTKVWLRGEQVEVQQLSANAMSLGEESLKIKDLGGDLRLEIERHLRKLAVSELPQRLKELAQQHQLDVHRITIRSQKTRWGSCSHRKTISLNWKLIQTPDFVRDYIMLHELAHLKEMNHSARFWAEVKRLCPEYEAAEKWLKMHRGFLN